MTARTRMLVIGVIVPLAIAAAGIIAVIAALPRLPYPIAVHWGPSGAANNFGSPIEGLVLLAIVTVGYSVFAFVVARSRHEGVTLNQRMILAIGPFLASVMTGIIAGSTLMQMDVADPRLGPSIVPVMIGSFVGALVIAVLAWFLLPEISALPETEPVGPAEAMPATRRALWTQHIGPPRALGAALAVILALAIIGGGVALWFAAPVAALVIYLVVLISVGALAASSLYWRVTVDREGFRAVSALGVIKFVVPTAEVASAAAVTVEPVRDFGGWGIRWGGKRSIGVITRAGEALEVRCTDGRVRVVTVSRADEAAGLLNSFAQHA